jgi:hypothetical protein
MTHSNIGQRHCLLEEGPSTVNDPVHVTGTMKETFIHKLIQGCLRYKEQPAKPFPSLDHFSTIEIWCDIEAGGLAEEGNISTNPSCWSGGGTN